MYEIVLSGGWLMLPILLCSLLAFAIVFERFWTLNKKRILPPNLLQTTWEAYRAGRMNVDQIIALRKHSPLGEVFAAGMANMSYGRQVMKDAMEDAGSKVSHDIERFLSALGTIAAITPLLGLLGTVVGMIDVFAEIMLSGTGNAGVLAGGISQALVTTATGLTVAIPSMVFHRVFERRIDSIVVEMEQQSTRLIDAIFADKAAKEEAKTKTSTGSKKA